MALGLWKKKKIIRRYEDAMITDGYVSSGYEDEIVMVDVQTTSDTSKTEADGDEHTQRVKAFGDYQMRVADRDHGVKADLLWFQGLWFECTASRLSENTFLKHYTSEFVQCLDQPDPPSDRMQQEVKR